MNRTDQAVLGAGIGVLVAAGVLTRTVAEPALMRTLAGLGGCLTGAGLAGFMGRETGADCRTILGASFVMGMLATVLWLVVGLGPRHTAAQALIVLYAPWEEKARSSLAAGFLDVVVVSCVFALVRLAVPFGGGRGVVSGS